MGRITTSQLKKFEDCIKCYNRILLDTNSFIYFMEDHELYADLLQVIFDKIEQGSVIGISSTLVLTEVLTKPIKDNNRILQDQYIAFMNFYPNLFLRDIDRKVAIKAAKLRGKYGIKTPDSIFVATAFEEYVGAIITNDIRLKKIEGMDFLILADYI